MASISVMRYLIECDGCQVKFGGTQGFASLTETRAAAYADGWRFPYQVNVNGAAARTTSDVCPACTAGWTPQQRASRQRVLTQAEASRL